MPLEGSARRCEKAAEAINRHENRRDGTMVVASLHAGLVVLRNLLYLRVHQDVQRLVGRDSMLIPTSEFKSELAAKRESDLYQIAESAAVVAEYGYLPANGKWYTRWLATLQLDDAATDAELLKRIDEYTAQPADQRRLAFTDALVSVLPGSQRAPLVLFQLLPISIWIATALAFNDSETAMELRTRQRRHLPAIDDCQSCHGRVLENGEQCAGCGNPLWRSEWLTSAD